MKIKWYGHAAFRIQSDDGFSVITDPYTPDEIGYAPITDPAHVVLISSDDDDAHCRADLIDGKPEVVNALNVARSNKTRSVFGINVQAIEAAECDDHPDRDVPGQNGMYRWEQEGIKFAHMGDVGNPLSAAQQDFFQNVDVLFALAGGHLTISLPDLMEMVHRVNPRLIVPMHFRTLTYRHRNALWIERFLAHFREDNIDFACAHEVKLSKDDLPDTSRILVMDYAR